MQSQYSSPSLAAAPALEYVGVGRRFVAVLIDGSILFIVVSFIDRIFNLNTAVAVGGDAWNQFKHMGPAATLAIIIPLVYFIIMEAMLGATLGKLVLGIRIVKLDGSPIGWGESIIRNLLRYIDQIPYGVPYLLGAIMVWTSPTRQRLGDRVAHTVVVRRR